MSASGMTGARADAIELLTTQHREVEQLWTQLQRTRSTELGQRMVELLSRHDAIETQLLYPELRDACGEQGERLSSHSLDEHGKVRRLLTEVDGRDFGDDRIFSTMRECMDNVLHHAQEEEAQLFPLLRSCRDEARLMDLGTRMTQAYEMAPTHPHPHTPTSKMGSTIAGAVSGVVDRARDAMRDAGDRG